MCMTHTLNLELTTHTFTLRPTLAALHRIEVETGIAICELVATQITPEDAHLILHAAGANTHDLTDDECLSAAQSFLIYATQDTVALNWREMFMMYVGMMNKPATEFWNITPAEYVLAVEGFCLHRGITPDAAGMPATSQDLAEMVRRFGTG